jgi:2-polyprenyl-3-methyl-5-hydroxy-6-metoxy-1,4-benzoquinol methylase
MGKHLQDYWETVYRTKEAEEVSWTEDIPKTSLDFIDGFKLEKTAKIVDIGGGDSKLVDYLLEAGFEDITVLDISSSALEKSKKRLGERASRIKWIVGDVTEFISDTKYDVWHDRATFHFLTTEKEIQKYIDTATKSVKGYMTIGTFSENGPEKCSGLAVKQYNEQTLQRTLNKDFDKLKCITEDHVTPFKTKQNFLFCSFKRTA